MPKLMIKFLFLIILILLWEQKLFAANYFYLRNVDNCLIKIWKNGNWQNTSTDRLVHTPLEIKQNSKDPNFVEFVRNQQSYIASSNCVYEASKEFPEIYDSSEKSQKLTAEIIQNTPFEQNNNYNRIFLSIDGGATGLQSGNRPVVEYNSLIKYIPANPILWTGVSKSDYAATSAWGIGFGIEKFENGFLSLRIKNFNGTKVDSVSGLNINNNVTIVGDWYYSEVLTNYYLGYKKNFPNNSNFIPTLAGFLGLSTGNTLISDGTTTYSFRSYGIGALVDAGIEYNITKNFRIGLNGEYEYLGKRNLSSKDSSTFINNTQTTLDYSNISLLLGLKSYF